MSTVFGIILSPLIASALIILTGKRAGMLAFWGSSASLVFALVALFGGKTGSVLLPALPQLPAVLSATSEGLIISAMVGVVGTLILLYAQGYMAQEKATTRFFALMSFFIFGMQLFVFSGDWFTLITAWELISVASYFLIAFYQTDIAVAAGSRAFITTRSADTGLLLGVLILFALTGTTNISATLAASGFLATLATLFIVVAGIAKAAQVPFDGWLRDAMAGPTPVSALLHSATLVAAGIILLIRIFPLMTPTVLLLIGIVGGATAIVAGLTALTQSDLKRTLAASTSAQLGLMAVAIGAGAPAAALLHLIANAAMKGSLFLGAGVFQHRREGTELALLKGVGKTEKFVFLAFALAGLALTGIPPLAGFFTKDAIVAGALTSPFAGLFVPLALLASLLTGAYITRTFKVLWQGKGEDRLLAGSRFMYAGMAGLVLFVITFFLIIKPLERGVGFEIVEGSTALFLGLAAAVGGLIIGWVWKEALLSKNIVKLAQDGLAISTVFDSFFAKITFSLADYLSKTETLLVQLPEKIAAVSLAQGRAFSLLETSLTGAVFSFGRANLSFGGLSQTYGEASLESIIADTLKGIRSLGDFGRRLQTGLIHQEMAYAVFGGGIIIFFYLVITMIK